MIVLGLEIKSTALLTRDGKKEFRKFRKQLLQDTAEHWHEEIFPQHFDTSARFRYRYESRTKFYRNVTKKQEGKGEGKTAMLQLSGKSRRFMLAFRTISGSAKSATLTMKPPGYFANPFVGSFTDPSGKTKTISHQPEKVAEATKQNNTDRRRLQEFAAKKIERWMNQPLPANVKKFR